MVDESIEVKPKFGIGDKVVVIKYGGLFWENKKSEHLKAFKNLSFPVVWEDDTFRVLDSSPELVGKQGLICEVSITQGIISYAIDGIKGKHAWYDENQLEMVNQNPNNISLKTTFGEISFEEWTKFHAWKNDIERGKL